MNLLRFLFSKVFLRHLGIAIGIALILLLLAYKGLAIYTRHGNNYIVPEYMGITLNDIKLYNLARDFEFVVLDSVYDNNLEPGTIVMQDPLPNSLVKKNRKIYFTIVASLPECVSMPDLVDLTYRQALSTLETYGLGIGKIDYKPDIAKNAVLKQNFEGEEILPGTQIIKGSTIDLVLGQGLGSTKIPIPLLLGLTQEEAHQLIRDHLLNIGANIIEDEDETDPDQRVYRQHPAYSPETYINPGQQIDLWYCSAKTFNFDSLLNINKPDTLFFEDNFDFEQNF
ncbi:MAG: PASTA domain-containing protein [Bacteroidales bacterium]|jgi:beta-lactam-binding protein with PASTA domain|nr:PASTA domain-containing protein [Bacteroidales bacterium]